MLYALLRSGPLITTDEATDIDDNLLLVAHCGRDPDLRLRRIDGLVSLRGWADEILAGMQGVCELLDATMHAPVYSLALAAQWEKVYQPELTPSAKMMSIIQENKESFFEFSLNISQQYKDWFCSQKIPVEKQIILDNLSRQSQQKQMEIEASDRIDFDTFLESYFS